MKDCVSVLGSLNYDFLVKQKRMPTLGETYVGDKLIELCGGKGANQAAQCGRLGLETFMIGKVGDDIYGTKMINELKKSNVDTKYIKKGSDPCGMGIVHIMPDGEYYSTILRGANFELSFSDINAAEDIIRRSKIMIFQLETPIEIIEYTMSLARKYDCYIILNAAPATEITKKMYEFIDCLIVNESEASFYTENNVQSIQEAQEASHYLYNLINGLTIVTLGKKGSVAYDGHRDYFTPAIEVNSVDSTGAGDAYTSALVYSLYQDWDIEKSMAFATKVSSITVTKDGGQNSFPFLEEV
ncbi:ribokinase [Salipaludibacillus sp. CF4.18]|uniref:ribokinase n=1 Tax=Salipaludibacillus sp. CF4.18 TaxID=3373081 RepID=UPI003EE5555D